MPSKPPGKLNGDINSVTNRMERSFVMQTKLICALKRYLNASCMLMTVLGHVETAMEKTSKAL